MMRPIKLRISYLSLTKASLYFHCAFRFDNPMTCAHVRLLGPCFKTGQADAYNFTTTVLLNIENSP
jgi:hypothetical protein